jgi:hemerythrin-like domain-containing protein
MNPVQTRFEQDHRDIEALLEDVANHAASANPALAITFNELEQRLMTHMEAEEQYLLPLVEVSHPGEADRTRLEHARIRQLVSELGLAIELHAVREPQIAELVQLLREHAAREDRTIYTFAGERASSAVEHRLAAMLKAAARSVLAGAKRSTQTLPEHERVQPH